MGDDPANIVLPNATDKAAFLSLAFGVLGGSVGGIFGSLEGIDESMDLERRSDDEIKLILNKLNSRSRYPEALPENIKIESSALHKNIPKSIEGVAPAQSPISLNIDFASKKQKRGLRRFHLSLEPGIFISQGTSSLIKAFRGWGFGDTKHDWVINFFTADPRSINYPEGGTDNGPLFKNIKIEFSLTQKIALGFSYSSLPRSGIDGFKYLETYVDFFGLLVDDGLDLNGNFEGSVYYFSAVFMPIPDAYLRKSSFKIGAGLGLSDIDYTVSLVGKSSNFSNSSLSLMTFAEYNYWLNRGLTLGSYINYKYIPCRVGFQLDADWKGQRILVDFPKKKVDFGGFGIGLILGLHF